MIFNQSSRQAMSPCGQTQDTSYISLDYDRESNYEAQTQLRLSFEIKDSGPSALKLQDQMHNFDSSSKMKVFGSEDYENARQICKEMLGSSFDWVGKPYLLRTPPTPLIRSPTQGERSSVVQQRHDFRPYLKYSTEQDKKELQFVKRHCKRSKKGEEHQAVKDFMNEDEHEDEPLKIPERHIAICNAVREMRQSIEAKKLLQSKGQKAYPSLIGYRRGDINTHLQDENRGSRPWITDSMDNQDDSSNAPSEMNISVAGEEIKIFENEGNGDYESEEMERTHDTETVTGNKSDSENKEWKGVTDHDEEVVSPIIAAATPVFADSLSLEWPPPNQEAAMRLDWQKRSKAQDSNPRGSPEQSQAVVKRDEESCSYSRLIAFSPVDLSSDPEDAASLEVSDGLKEEIEVSSIVHEERRQCEAVSASDWLQSEDWLEIDGSETSLYLGTK
ncbi:hypothetical protein BCR41DRAFT_403004 [Lobosporangium transversale]|uniref:Uncharacterized protein n=1 Tax=Lobosporangium transversale TaxID=64571 RepID=A0A1Y2H6X9_9FUNG|nr:hypothetical protein BCR41DRAFT_403004 [Lobosporangium transversale]ORZ28802.1 hypothetical protein BCR41DRAFT_403004 [Lobosporangium transversale]|eukprot:XP_021886475.1 hypothetical protein BCR41DRAFT_403004 [Lobosporangium transversale]